MSAPSGRIGRYELVDRLGQGGMGTLYLARDPALGRTVAIKLLSVQNDELRERFAREARAAAALTHHNIVTIYDVGEQDGQPFIAMEYIEGETLAQIIRRGTPLLLTRKIELAQELCTGLGYAHRLGIVHRDVKPANIMVATDGVLKLLDFGLARLASDATQAGLTAIGVMVGTPHYMAPEQIEGRAIDRRTDIFAVGLVLYELLSHRKAYPGDSAYAVIHRILHEPPTPIEAVCPGLDPALAAIVRRAIEKEPARRYQDLASLNVDLGRVRQALTAASSDATVLLGQTLITPPPDLRGEGGSGVPPTPRSDRRETLARRRASEIQRHLEAARARLEANDPQGAVDACEAAALIDPDDPRVLQALEHANNQLASRRVEQLVQEGRASLDAGALSQAERAIAEAQAILPESDDLAALRRDLQRTLEHRRRQEEHERSARAVIEEARRMFADGAHRAALDRLAAFSPPHDRVAGVHRELAGAYAAIEQERRDAEERREREAEEERRRQLLGQRLAAAEAARAAGDLAGALAIVQQVLEQFPAHPRAAQLHETLERALRAERERAELDARAAAAIVTARRQFAAGQHAAAIRILSEFPAPHAAVGEALAALREELERIERSRLEEATRREREERRRIEEERRVKEEARRATVDAALQAARETLAAGELAAARSKIAEALVLAPSNEEAARLREEIEQAVRERRAREQLDQRAAQAVDEARGLLAADRGIDAVHHLESFTPAHPAVSAALEAVRREIDSLERERAEEAGRARRAEAREDRATPRRSRARVWAVGAAAALVAIGAGWWVMRPAPAPEPQATVSPSNPPAAAPTTAVAPAPAAPDGRLQEVREAVANREWTRAVDLLDALQRTAPSALADTGLMDDVEQGTRQYAREHRRAAEQSGAGSDARFRDALEKEKQAAALHGLAAARTWIAAGDGFAAARPAAAAPAPAATAHAADRTLQRLLKSGNDAEALQLAAEVLRQNADDSTAREALVTLQQRARAAAAASRKAAIAAGADTGWATFRTAADRERAAAGAAPGAGAVRAWWDVSRLYDDAAGQAKEAGGLVERASARARAGERAEAATLLEEAHRMYPASSRIEAALGDLYGTVDRDARSAGETARQNGKAATQAFRAAAAEEQRARGLGRTPEAIRALARAADGYKAALSSAAPQPSEAPAASPPSTDVAAIRSQVANVLAAVARAYENKDMDAINRLLEFMKYDSLKQIEHDFKEYRSIQWSVTLDRLDMVGDGSVRAACTVRRQIDKKSGRDISDVRPTVFTLRRSGNAWKIVGQTYPE